MPKKSKSKLKKVCFDCGTFDPKKRSFYKCAVPGTCPGEDWSEKKKRQALAKRGTKNV